MIEAATRVPGGASVQADVCVVGAGAAGIPLALSLAGKGLSVVVLEAGTGPDGLGGDTRTWQGRCVPLDPIDMERRAYLPSSGWPISWEGLQPWSARAAGWLEAGRFATQVPPSDRLLVGGLDDRLVNAAGVERLSCPTDVGRRYRARLHSAQDLRVLTGAHATAVRLQPDGRRAHRVSCATRGGRRFDVCARAIVLAAGGIETPRLLLASSDVQRQGIGNATDQVGRYYQCQLRGPAGLLAMRGQRPRGGYDLAPDGVPFRRRLSITAPAQRAQGLLNASLWLEPPQPGHPSLRDAWATARDFVARHAPSSLAAQQHARRWPAWRADLPHHVLWVQAEQSPLASSRVTLSDSVDALGLRRVRVDWRHCQADIASVRRTLSQVRTEFARAAVGTVVADDEALDAGALRPVAGHHIGTARMGRDPRTSVVDADGRVHGVQNLYVAGSAVFPTSGHADPTLTIVALALRMADHLVQRLQPRRTAALELFA